MRFTVLTRNHQPFNFILPNNSTIEQSKSSDPRSCQFRPWETIPVQFRAWETTPIPVEQDPIPVEQDPIPVEPIKLQLA